MIIYLDDILLMIQSPEGLARGRDTLLHRLYHLGWLINWKQSVLQPTRIMDLYVKL